MPLRFSGSELRDRMWKLSRQVPSAGWPALSTMRHAWSYVLTCRPQASASYATRMPNSWARSASWLSCAAASASSSSASGETLEQTRTVSVPSLRISSNLCRARRRLRANSASGTASMSRIGW